MNTIRLCQNDARTVNFANAMKIKVGSIFASGISVLLTAALLLLAIIPGASAQLAHRPAPRLPNIIFILADDLSYGDLGCYGQTMIKTPNIDKLAGEGMRFTDFYAGDTVCAPSRCTLMTGLHTGHARIRSNGTIPLKPEDITVAEVLKQAYIKE